MKILGIDPGASGALAVLDTKKGTARLLDMPVRTYRGANNGKRGRKKAPRKYVDGHAVALWIGEQQAEFGVIESVQSFGKQDASRLGSLAKFLTAFGVALGSVQCVLGEDHVLVTPPEWKRKLGLIGMPKEASHKLACKLYPKAKSLLYGPLGGLKIDRAEALLLAHWYSLQVKVS